MALADCSGMDWAAIADGKITAIVQHKKLRRIKARGLETGILDLRREVFSRKLPAKS